MTVVTQVFPKGEAFATKQAPPPSTKQAPPPSTKQAPPPDPASKMDDMTAAFLRGAPHVLGVIQIFIGLLCVLFSLTAVFSPVLILHAPLCLSAIFVISGSLTVAAGRRTSVGLVRACLVWNLLSVVVGLVGVAYLCWLLADGPPPSQRLCDTLTQSACWPVHPQLQQQTKNCYEKMKWLDVSVYGPLGSLLVLLLQVCVVVTVCVFSCRALGRCHSSAPIMVEVGDHGDPLLSRSGSDVSLLGSEGEEASTLPHKSP
ncbi:membrane-spanning 4-domains subfamily A member 4A-like [Sander lucioperca]|uniref:membrane-spanning 4-domains subfamily A member 4A-like n=1 Tax=Sander lucioperca TaxID=283035 RepID=UPI001653CFC1|nr:membrane-spanning 4-domains subfamily A member 4A-like [Sander lucioperca]